MSDQIDFTREEYELAKVALERSDVPVEALALLSAWIEGERLLVDDQEDVGGITYCRMDARIIAPLLRAVRPGFRSESQGGRGDQQAARQGIVSS